MRLILPSLLLLTLAVASKLSKDDFYTILGVDLDATSSDIRLAFKKRSVDLHPDKNPNNPNAIKEFQRLERAYSVLSDKKKKDIYDYQGIEDLEEEERGGGRNKRSAFDSFFGGNSKPRGRNVLIEMQVTLEELYSGTTKNTTIERNIICRTCRGTGAKNGKTKPCKKCSGRGVVLVQQEMAPGFVVEMQQACPACNGKGRTAKAKCGECGGRRVVREQKTLVTEIEAGMDSSQEIVKEKQSEQRPGVVPGDVVVRLTQRPHPVFRRSGSDLYHETHLSLAEALLGFDKELTHLDGHKVRLSNADSSPVIQPFQEDVTPMEGMPLYQSAEHAFGNLHVIYTIDFPKAISEKQRKIVEDILS